MADDASRNALDTDLDDINLDETEDGSDASGEKARKPGWLKALLLVGPLLAAAIAAAVMCQSMFNGSTAAADVPEEEHEQPELEDPSEKHMLALGELVVNLCGDRARRFLKVDMHVEVGSAALKRRLEAPYHMVRLRDALITLLSAKLLEDVAEPDSKTRLRREIRDELNGQLRVKDGIVRVYFSDFQVQ